MDHIPEILVGVLILLIAGGIGSVLRIILQLRDDVLHIKYELSLNGKNDTLKDRVATLQVQMRDVQKTVGKIYEETT